MCKKRILSHPEVVKIFTQTASAVAYLHERKMVHRDIKPENILIDRAGNFKLCDFGFCAPYGTDTKRNTLCGTMEYLAPEVITSKQQDDKVDIWCLGILLYELVHKKTPYGGKNVMELIQEIRTKALGFRSTLHPELKTIIQMCIRQEPSHRPSAAYILANFPVLRETRAEQTPQPPQMPKPPASYEQMTLPKEIQPIRLTSMPDIPVTPGAFGSKSSMVSEVTMASPIEPKKSGVVAQVIQKTSFQVDPKPPTKNVDPKQSLELSAPQVKEFQVLQSPMSETSEQRVIKRVFKYSVTHEPVEVKPPVRCMSTAIKQGGEEPRFLNQLISATVTKGATVYRSMSIDTSLRSAARTFEPERPQLPPKLAQPELASRLSKSPEPEPMTMTWPTLETPRQMMDLRPHETQPIMKEMFNTAELLYKTQISDERIIRASQPRPDLISPIQRTVSAKGPEPRPFSGHGAPAQTQAPSQQASMPLPPSTNNYPLYQSFGQQLQAQRNSFAKRPPTGSSLPENVNVNANHVVNIYQKNSNNGHGGHSAAPISNVYTKSSWGVKTTPTVPEMTFSKAIKPQPSRGQSSQAQHVSETESMSRSMIAKMAAPPLAKYSSENAIPSPFQNSITRIQRVETDHRPQPPKQSYQNHNPFNPARKVNTHYNSGSLPRKLEDISNRFANPLGRHPLGFFETSEPLRFRSIRVPNHKP